MSQFVTGNSPPDVVLYPSAAKMAGIALGAFVFVLAAPLM